MAVGIYIIKSYSHGISNHSRLHLSRVRLPAVYIYIDSVTETVGGDGGGGGGDILPWTWISC